jgi:hypothetical protein
MRRDHPRPSLKEIAGVTGLAMLAGVVVSAVIAGLLGQLSLRLMTTVRSMTTFLSNNAAWVIGVLILLAFLAFGWADLLRLSIHRVWAISSVGYRESVRRKVWLIPGLGIIGFIAVSYLAHPFDEQDAIRQMTKYCLFASGVVVVLATLILACTNLPREIDNRVIYTIVTKPATRLEIVLGKTLAFARTAGLILLIMGVFSYIFLFVCAAYLRANVRTKLQNLPPADLSRETLQHYANEGLLGAKNYARAESLQIYGKPPAGDAVRWIVSGTEQYVAFPVDVSESAFEGESRLIITLNLKVKQQPLNKREMDFLDQNLPAAATQPTNRSKPIMPPKPEISVALMDPEFYNLAGSMELWDAIAIGKLQAEGKFDPNAKHPDASAITLTPTGPEGAVAVVVAPPKVMDEKIKAVAENNGRRRFYVTVQGLTFGTLLGVGPDSLSVQLESSSAAPVALELKDAAGKALAPQFRARQSTAGGQQLRGSSDRADLPVAVYEFRGAKPAVEGGNASFEFRAKVERGSDLDVSEAETASLVEISVINPKTGQTSGPITIVPDVDRPTFFSIPAAALEGGDFDVHVRSLVNGHFVGLRPTTLQAVVSSQGFALNLIKSLVILWMLAILVVIIAIFCSTFVSWPIAVVLTLVILLGRWAVNQLGDPATPQQIWTDLTGNKGDVVTTKLFTTTLDKLNKVLQAAAKVLPDVDQFRATEDIERGVSIPMRTLASAGWVLVGFGFPTLALAYIFLKKKEVAP